MNQRWKPVGSTGTGRVDRPVGSRFFDLPVKPVEKPVKFSFFGTKRHLSTNQNILIYIIKNKTFYKKSVLTNDTFRKHLLNGFKLLLYAVTIKACTSRDVFRVKVLCHAPPHFWPRHKAKSAKYTFKSRNQILIKHACGRGLRYLAF